MSAAAGVPATPLPYIRGGCALPGKGSGVALPSEEGRTLTTAISLPFPVRHRQVVDAGEFLTIHLWRSTPEVELPLDLQEVLREAEAEEASAGAEAQLWANEAQALESLARRLEAAEQRLRNTLRCGPLWAAAAAAFALARLAEERAVQSARESAAWAAGKAQQATRRLKLAQEALKSLQARAAEVARVCWHKGPRVSVRLRRVNGDFVPVHADDKRAIPAAVEAARAWLESRVRRSQPSPRDLQEWALERELQRLSEGDTHRTPQAEEEFDSFSEGWHWEEELQRRASADRVLLRSRRLRQLREPVVVLLQRDNALQGRAWEAARAWLADVVRQLIARGVRKFRVPGTARGREAAELIRQLGGDPIVFSLPKRQGDDDLQAAYEAALQGARGLILVAGSAEMGRTPLYLLDPALGAATRVAPLARCRWVNHRLEWTRRPDLRVPWVRFDVAAAVATPPPAD
jgi:hypothetical protein